MDSSEFQYVLRNDDIASECECSTIWGTIVGSGFVSVGGPPRRSGAILGRSLRFLGMHTESHAFSKAPRCDSKTAQKSARAASSARRWSGRRRWRRSLGGRGSFRTPGLRNGLDWIGFLSFETLCTRKGCGGLNRYAHSAEPRIDASSMWGFLGGSGPSWATCWSSCQDTRYRSGRRGFLTEPTFVNNRAPEAPKSWNNAPAIRFRYIMAHI
jgi:hypothetical protein